jgi:hypothetical protein
MEIEKLPWRYRGEVVTPDMIPVDAIGMVYKITRYPDESYVRLVHRGVGMVLPGSTKCYIGKKLLHSTRKVNIGKRAVAAERASRADGKAKTVKKVIKDSGWSTYNSSCVPLQEEIKANPELFVKEILHWCWGKKQMSYLEVEEMILHDVLRVDSYNGNVSGKWYRRDLIKPEKK